MFAGSRDLANLENRSIPATVQPGPICADGHKSRGHGLRACPWRVGHASPRATRWTFDPSRCFERARTKGPILGILLNGKSTAGDPTWLRPTMRSQSVRETSSRSRRRRKSGGESLPTSKNGSRNRPLHRPTAGRPTPDPYGFQRQVGRWQRPYSVQAVEALELPPPTPLD